MIQPLHCDGYDVRWQRQIENPILQHIMRTLQPSDIRRQCPIILWPTLMQGLVVKTLLTPGAQVWFITATRLLQAFEGPEPKFLFTYLRHGGTHDQRVAPLQNSLIPQMVQRGKELPARQIASGTDDDKNMGLNLMFQHVQAPPNQRSTVR